MRSSHFIPDLVLVGFAREIHETATAAAQIAESDTPRVAFHASRGAFEAVQELMYLASRGDDYPIAGARARVSELLDWEHAIGLARASGLNPPTPAKTAREQFEVDRAEWAKENAEASQIMDEAWEGVEESRKDNIYHWSGIRRGKLASAYADSIGGDESTHAMHRSWYNLLSLQSHPAPRLEQRHLRVVPGGFVVDLGGPSDPAFLAAALGAAFVAVATANVIVPEFLETSDA